MSDSQLKQTFTTDSTKLEQAYERLLHRTEDVLSATSRLARASKSQSETAVQGFKAQTVSVQDIIKSIGSYVAAYASVHAAASLVTGELRQQLDLFKEMSAAQAAFANPRASMLQNLTGISPADKAKVKQAVDKMAIEGLGTRDALTEAFGQLTSATPELSVDERLATLRAAARFAPQPDQLGPIAAALGDTMKLTGSTDPMENLGVLAATAAKSRGTSPSMIAQNIIPKAATMLSYGATTPEALSFPVAIQNVTGDVEGRESMTAALQAGSQMAEFFKPENIRAQIKSDLEHEANLGWDEKANEETRGRLVSYMQSKGSKATTFDVAFESFKREQNLQDEFFAKEADRRTHGADSFAEYIHELQQNPELFTRFASGFHGEEKMRGAVLGLLGNAESQQARQFEEFSAEGIPAGKEAAAAGEEAVENVQNDPYIQAQRAKVSSEAAAHKIKTEAYESGTYGGVYQQLDELLKAANTRTLEKSALLDAYTIGVNQKGVEPITMGQRILHERAEHLLDPTRREVPFMGSQAGYEPLDEVSAERRSAAMTLRQAEAEMGRIGFELTAAQQAERAMQNMQPKKGGPQPPKLKPPAAPNRAGGAQPIHWDAAWGELEDFSPEGADKWGDEFADLRAGAGAKSFSGREDDLNRLRVESTQAANQTKDQALGDALRRVADVSERMLNELQKLNQKTDDAAQEQRAANRSAGARSTRAKAGA